MALENSTLAGGQHDPSIAKPPYEDAGDGRPSDDESTSKNKKDLEAQGENRRGSRLDSRSDVGVGAQREMEKDNAIQYRTCSWQKTAFLLFSEYICLAIMSFPWS
jgi:cobalamin biosynthesis protein CbiG